MIDTHAHLNFSDFEKDLDEVIKKSFDEGVEKIVVASSSVESSKRAVEIAEKYTGVFAAVGIHPHDVEEADNFKEIERLAEHQKVVAIGETGLDYFYLSSRHSREGGNPAIENIKKKQKELFELHIDLSEKLNLPLIIHNRNSDDDFYEVLKDFAVGMVDTPGVKDSKTPGVRPTGKPFKNKEIKGVVHCFTGDWDFAEKILDLGLLISFTGIVTFDKTGNLENVIQNIPLNKIMVETDAPYLAPVPYRGKRCEPQMVKEVIQKIANIKDLSFEKVDKTTSAVAKSFFGIR